MENGLSNDVTVLKKEIAALADRMSLERLRMLYITALVWADKGE